MNVRATAMIALLGLAITLSGCTHPPIALFEADCDVNHCHFDASGTLEGHAPIVSYDWKFYERGHTEAHVVGTASGVTTSFVFSMDEELGDEWHANLTVTDERGDSMSFRSKIR